ncbi:SIMPL domain-containing protein [Amnibacterium endophyticum]|uniref:SIMPL domain-containing protein n=1 Tax=Amnibacterium endophyticum TaxID=2109337 RepID=A0ABW4LHC7_9MICO
MVLIAVHGAAARFLPAERGTLALGLALEHADREVVVRDVAALHERLVADAKSFVHRGAATWWGSDQVRVHSVRRYRKDSEVADVVQAAAAEVRVKFRDFGALSDWVEQAGSLEGVTVADIDWTVTEAHRTQVQREVRVQAVRDATQRAEAYAAAIGAESVELQALWEPGLRPGADSHAGGGFTTRAMLSASGSSGFELRPDDIEIAAEVTADFLVRLPA